MTSSHPQEISLSTAIRGTRKGFSLIEIIIGAVIIGMIMAGTFYFVGIALERGRRSKTETAMHNLKQALTLYQADTNELPQKLTDLITRPENVSAWKGAYLPGKVPLDGWGNKFRYEVTPGQKHPYTLISYGSSAGKSTPKDKWISIWDL